MLLLFVIIICIIWIIYLWKGNFVNVPTELTTQITNNFNNTKSSFDTLLLTAITDPESLSCPTNSNILPNIEPNIQSDNSIKLNSMFDDLYKIFNKI